MADLGTNFGITFVMDKINDARPGRFMFRRIKARAARGNAAFGGNAGHFGVNKARPALGAFTVMHQMPIRRAAINGLILGHWRNNDTVFYGHIAQFERHKHRMQRMIARGCLPGPACKPAFGIFKPGRVAQAQIFMADTLGPGQQRIGKLHRIKVKIALNLLEPFHRIARSRLQAQNFQAAFIFIFGKGLGQAGFGMKIFRQGNGTFQRQLGA